MHPFQQHAWLGLGAVGASGKRREHRV